MFLILASFGFCSTADRRYLHCLFVSGSLGWTVSSNGKSFSRGKSRRFQTFPVSTIFLC